MYCTQQCTIYSVTQADLIALMDKNGIGTDATQAEHIETIKVSFFLERTSLAITVSGCKMQLIEPLCLYTFSSLSVFIPFCPLIKKS